VRTSRRVAWCAVAVLLMTNLVAAKKKTPSLIPVATYDTGLGENGSEIVSVRDDGIAAITNIAGSVDVLDLSNPSHPQLVRRVLVPDIHGRTPNSVAVHPHDDYFLVVIGRSGLTGRVAAYRLWDGALLASANVGIQPDSIAISPNGKYAVIANEAESPAQGDNGGDGSLSIVDLRSFEGEPGDLVVTNVHLPSASGLDGFSTGRTDDIGRLPVTNEPATLEPESVAFSPNSRYAYVTLQENNGVVRLTLATGELLYFGLGETRHDADLQNGGGYLPIENALTAFREPDGIALDKHGRFFVTADEGDTRNATGGSGPRGGRTVSIFDADTGELIGDTGSQIDDAAALAGAYPDNRSDRGASEPEVLDLTDYRGLTLVAVGLERANAVALIDVSDPSEPTVIAIAAIPFAPTQIGAGPEGVKFFRRGGRLFVASANEVAGTLSILEVAF
jgi:DNA-binding beta-propeller fold protein YncE